MRAIATVPYPWQGMKEIRAELTTNRVKAAQSLHGRDRIRQAIQALGFPIR